MTSLPVLGINYRKSVTVDRAFPAALQDTISGYAYLVRKGYKRIAVAGDSAGAGLALALMQYLAKMAEKDDKRPDRIVMPSAACFYSPWADLTFSHDYRETVHFDISAYIIDSAVTGIENGKGADRFVRSPPRYAASSCCGLHVHGQAIQPS